VAEYYATRYTFELNARKAGTNLAHATCVTSRSGRIISLTTLSTPADDGKFAAQM
jgi:hypothetical protein